MRLLLGLVIILLSAYAVTGFAASSTANPASSGLTHPFSAAASQTPQWGMAPANGVHPAVARIIVYDRDGANSLGSGTLVAVEQDHGLVVTNWHVVRDSGGQIIVTFPNGFRSGATVLRANRDWDLAALAIWRPPVEPVAVASQAPYPGDSLTIAGYGPGDYRMATGRCIKYVSPGGNNPAEMVEVSVGARNGDSGGPIFNSRGELAGVLFGTAAGETTGSYCGRVRWFLGSVNGDFRRLQANPALLAQRSAYPATTPNSPQATPQPTAQPATSSSVATVTAVQPLPPVPWSGGAQAGQVSTETGVYAQYPRNVAAPTTTPTPPAAIPGSSQLPGRQGPGETNLLEFGRNILAAIGAFAIFFQVLSLLASSGAEASHKKGS